MVFEWKHAPKDFPQPDSAEFWDWVECSYGLVRTDDFLIDDYIEAVEEWFKNQSSVTKVNNNVE